MPSNQTVREIDASREMRLDDAAERLGGKRSTIHGWHRRGMPFDKGRKLPIVKRRSVTPQGRHMIGPAVFKKDVERIESLRESEEFDSTCEMRLEEAALRLGVDRATVYNWQDKGMPFDDDRKLPVYRKRFINARGRHMIGPVVLLKDIEWIEKGRHQEETDLVPAHEAQQMLNCCRKTLDNKRDRGELPGAIQKPVWRGNLLRVAWWYPRTVIEEAARKQTSTKPDDLSWRHLDPDGAWMLAWQVCKRRQISLRFLKRHRNKKTSVGVFLHAQRIENPYGKGKFTHIWAYLEKDILAIDAALSAGVTIDDAEQQTDDQTAVSPATAAEPKTPPKQEVTTPRWDEMTSTLFWGDSAIRQFRKHPAQNQRELIEAFHRRRWEQTIPNPFGTDARKLEKTIYSLNQSLTQNFIHFAGDGTGEGAMWLPCDNAL
jgi:hypothetical protein